MQLSTRDMRIVSSLSTFQQLDAGQIREMHFSEHTTGTMCHRALHRLMSAGVIRRVEMRRLVGGSKGGAGQYAYQLDRKGWWMMNKEGSFKPHRNVRYHQILLADTYLLMTRLEKADLIKIDGWTTEADTLSDVEVRHDMRMDVTKRDGERIILWFEIDMATEGRKVIQTKVGRQLSAITGRDKTEWPIAPRVVWLACDEERAKELNWILGQMKYPELVEHFYVTTLNDLPRLFQS